MGGKGPSGETGYDATQEAIEELGMATADEIFKEIKQKYPGIWADDTIWQQIMYCTVNLRPAYEHWDWKHKILFLHEDGRYELYDLEVHGLWEGGRRT